MALMNLKGMMKEPVLGDAPKVPGLLKKKPFAPKQPTDGVPSLMKRLTGK